LTHAWLVHATAVPHVPVGVHVSTPLLFGSHCVVPQAQTPVPVPAPASVAPTVQFASQELALWPATQFAAQKLAFWPTTQYAVQELALLPQLQFCVQLLQLPVHTQSPVQLLQSPVTTVVAALLVSTASVVEGADLHAIGRHPKRTGTNQGFRFRPPRAIRCLIASIPCSCAFDLVAPSRRPAHVYTGVRPRSVVILRGGAE
jgi:hypothetical protein